MYKIFKSYHKTFGYTYKENKAPNNDIINLGWKKGVEHIIFCIVEDFNIITMPKDKEIKSSEKCKLHPHFKDR